MISWKRLIFVLLLMVPPIFGCSGAIPPNRLDGAAKELVDMFASRVPAGKNFSVAALGFEDMASEGPTQITRELEERLNHYLSVSERFRVLEVDESRLARIQSILKKQSTPLWNEEEAIELGRFEVLELFVTGEVKNNGDTFEILARMVSLETTGSIHARVSFAIPMGGGPKVVFFLIGIIVVLTAARVLKSKVAAGKSKQTVKDFEPVVCAHCGRSIDTIYNRGGICLTPTCDNPICAQCWNGDRIRYCSECVRKSAVNQSS